MNIKEIEEKISRLPTGGLTIKKISNKSNGKQYEYKVYQWRENNKQHSRYLTDEEYIEMSNLISERKILEKQLHCLKQTLPLYKSEFSLNTLTGESLKELTYSVKNYKQRKIIVSLKDFVYGNEFNHVFILYGLRRTGKTTMMKQIISEMNEEKLSKTAFIQINTNNTMAELNQDCKVLSKLGYKYIFIDEVTLLEDFIDGAALLSDLFAASGIKIVLSGTDSLGFWFTKSNELYDRCKMTFFHHYHLMIKKIYQPALQMK